MSIVVKALSPLLQQRPAPAPSEPATEPASWGQVACDGTCEGKSHLGIRLSAHSVCNWEYFGCSFCSVPNQINHTWSCPCRLWPPRFAAWYRRGTMVCGRIEVLFSLINQLRRFKEFAMFGWIYDFRSAALYRCYIDFLCWLCRKVVARSNVNLCWRRGMLCLYLYEIENRSDLSCLLKG